MATTYRMLLFWCSWWRLAGAACYLPVVTFHPSPPPHVIHDAMAAVTYRGGVERCDDGAVGVGMGGVASAIQQ